MMFRAQGGRSIMFAASHLKHPAFFSKATTLCPFRNSSRSPSSPPARAEAIRVVPHPSGASGGGCNSRMRGECCHPPSGRPWPSGSRDLPPTRPARLYRSSSPATRRQAHRRRSGNGLRFWRRLSLVFEVTTLLLPIITFRTNGNFQVRPRNVPLTC